MRTFTILDSATGDSHDIVADFMTVDYNIATMRFWRKPHWYSRRRMIGCTNGYQFKVVTSRIEEQDYEIAHMLGVRL